MTAHTHTTAPHIYFNHCIWRWNWMKNHSAKEKEKKVRQQFFPCLCRKNSNSQNDCVDWQKGYPPIDADSSVRISHVYRPIIARQSSIAFTTHRFAVYFHLPNATFHFDDERFCFFFLLLPNANSVLCNRFDGGTWSLLWST